MREGTSLAENRSMKSLKLDSFITELNKKQNNKEIKRIKSDSCEGVGEILRPFLLLFYTVNWKIKFQSIHPKTGT